MAAQTAAAEGATTHADAGAVYAAERQAAKEKFAQGLYEDALRIWTGSLRHGCDVATLQANIAEALLRCGRPREAERACDAALQLTAAPEATLTKARLRRARARLCRRDFKGCVADATLVGKAARTLLNRAEGRTTTLLVPRDAPTLRAAVADTSCSVIRVTPGNYREKLVIARALTLVGDNALATIDAVEVHATGVTLDRVDVSGGVRVAQTASVEVRRCVLAHDGGVALTVAGTCLLDDAVVEHAKIGVVVNDGAALHVRGSIVQLCGLGINSKAPLVLENSIIEECGRGVVGERIDERGDCVVQEDARPPALDERARDRARLRLARRAAFGGSAPESESSECPSSDSEEDVDFILAAKLRRHT
jgi:hypothetical protein